jgi:hypothetical protein
MVYTRKINKKTSKKSPKGGAFLFSSTQKYKPIVKVVKNTDEIIEISREIGESLLGSIDVEKNQWIRKRVIPEIPSDCFGNPRINKYIQCDKIDKIIEIVSELFNNNDLHVKDNLDIDRDTNIEVHFAKAGTKEIGSGLTIHEDNHGGISGKLHTFIVYLDIKCNGGLLEVYDDRGNALTDTIDPRSDEGTTKVVMFNGGMMHRPTPITNGTRLIVTYQFRQRGDTSRRGGSRSKKSSYSRKKSKCKYYPDYKLDIDKGYSSSA